MRMRAWSHTCWNASADIWSFDQIAYSVISCCQHPVKPVCVHACMRARVCITATKHKGPFIITRMRGRHWLASVRICMTEVEAWGQRSLVPKCWSPIFVSYRCLCVCVCGGGLTETNRGLYKPQSVRVTAVDFKSHLKSFSSCSQQVFTDCSLSPAAPSRWVSAELKPHLFNWISHLFVK